MKLVKSLALGSAAALMTMTAGAQAADLPGAEPVDYVKVCDVKGSTGFFYIPGTNTCLQIGGYVRAELTSGEIVRASGTGLKDTDIANRTGYRVRARLWADARTETEYGALRTFIRLQIQRESGNVGQTARISNTPNLDGDDSLIDQAFVQFAGLTAGLTDSFWDFKPYSTFQNPFISDRTVSLFGYTAKVGDFSASISAEDKTARYRTSGGTSVNGMNGDANAGQDVPDIVANLRIKQGWGEAQVSGVVHRIQTRTVGTFAYIPLPGESAALGDRDSTWGWGVQGGVKLNLPTANTEDQKGDHIWAQAAYVDGAGLSYLGIGDQNVGSGTTQNITGFQPARDFVIVGGEVFKTRAMNANLGILHYWSPQWRSALQASYIDVNYRKVNADWSTGTLAGNIIWSPVKKLDIGAELVYVKNIDKANVGYGSLAKDDDAFVGRLRVQREF